MPCTLNTASCICQQGAAIKLIVQRCCCIVVSKCASAQRMQPIDMSVVGELKLGSQGVFSQESLTFWFAASRALRPGP